MHVLGLLLILVTSVRGQGEGESCEDTYSFTAGVCTKAYQCDSAKRDFQQNGIRPTFCSYTTFGRDTLVCCRDGYNILQTPETTTRRPVWDTRPPTYNNPNRDGKRVTERKCEEYSRGVVHKVDYIALVPEPETFSVTTAKCDYNTVELIIGGEKAEVGEFPHMAAIGWVDLNDEYLFSCGGSLISHNFVLTAGHCLRNPLAKDPWPVIVRLGDQNIDNRVNDGANPIDVPILRIHSHPDYRMPSKYNDIALLELASAVSFSAHVRAACLWTKPDFSGYDKVIATGWGVTERTSVEPSKDLRKVALSLLENDYCDALLYSLRNRNWDGFVDSQMCAGELSGGRDTCQGDSGSPLQVASKGNQCIFHIVGITSFGKKCAEAGLPAIYTRVSKYLDWIEQTVWPGE